MASGREISLEIITGVLEKNLFYKDEYEKLIKKHKPDAREKGFIYILSNGTIERCIELDYIIGKYSSKPVDRLKPYIRNILRMSVYQIKYMRVPDNAAVNEAVKLAAKKGYSGLRGFVNGVLRNIAKDINDIEYPDKQESYEEYLHIRYSMPEWIVKHFLGEMSAEETERAFEYFLEYAGTGIRLITSSPEDYFGSASTTQGRIFANTLHIEKSGSIEELPGFSEGAWVVQDESSMIPAHIIARLLNEELFETMLYEKMSGGLQEDSPEEAPDQDKKPLEILDLCAAPGGKVLQLADDLACEAHFTANDISEYKTGKILENAERLNIKNLDVRVRDALIDHEDDHDRYDAVIADLPCSGLGVIAKKPDIKYNTKPEDLSSLSKLQKQMLLNAAEYVKSGGVLVFSTCTVSHTENEDNVAYFLEKRSDFTLIDPIGYIPETINPSITEEGCIRILPGAYDSDGFFVAVFRKN